MKNQIYKDLLAIPKIEILWDQDISQHSTIKLKTVGKLIIVKNLDSLKLVIKSLHAHKQSFRFLGLGANQILLNKSGFIYIKYININAHQFPDKYFETYQFDSSVRLQKLVNLAGKLSLKGWDCLTGIPATLGGAIYMNAGTKFGDIAQIVKSVDILRVNGQIERHKVDSHSFSYRKNHFIENGDFILAAELKTLGVDPTVSGKITDYMDYRQKTQPLWGQNCGCVFKNPGKEGVSAGFLIEQAGLKGFKYKGLMVSDIHANFIENLGEGATSDEFFELVEIIREKVLIASGISLSLEVQF